jgi:hypothetical protein
MSRADDTPTPPARRVRRCSACHFPVTLHAEHCAVARAQQAELERIRQAAEDRVLTMYAARRWVRAVKVRAAERTMRGPAVCWFVRGGE